MQDAQSKHAPRFHQNTTNNKALACLESSIKISPYMDTVYLQKSPVFIQSVL